MTKLINRFLVWKFGPEKVKEWAGKFAVRYFVTRSTWKAYWFAFFG